MKLQNKLIEGQKLYKSQKNSNELELIKKDYLFIKEIWID